MATRVIAYLRVSTDKQADHGVSLDAQRAKIELYAQLYELELVDVVVDAGASAKTLDRPGLARALAALDEGKADALLVAKLDRLTRSVRDLGTLLDGYFGRKDGPALLVVAEQVDTRSAAGRLVLNVLMSVAQWEREAISERTTAAMQHKRASGEYTGGNTPFGWVVEDGRLVASPQEQRAISLALEMRDRGISLRKIGDGLTQAGITPRKGGVWAAASVKAVLEAKAA